MSSFPWWVFPWCFLLGSEPCGATAVAQGEVSSRHQEEAALEEKPRTGADARSAASAGDLTHVRDELARASVSLDGKTIDAARDAVSKWCEADPTDGWAHYHAAHAGYLGMIRALRDPEQKRDAAIFVRCRDVAVKHGRAALELLPHSSEPAALLAAIHGIEIGRDPMLGMTLGPKSDELCERALAADEKNPRAWIVRGQALLFKPSFVGGNPAHAVEAFQRAAELADAEAARTDVDARVPRWGRAEARCWLGQARTATGDFDGARAAYAEALEREPEYGWVKRELLPALEKKIAARTTSR